MSETLGFYFLLLGAALAVIGWLLLLGAAFRYHLGWGFGVLLFPPAAIVFVSRHFLRSLGGLLVILLGVAVAVSPIVINKFHLLPVEAKPIEKTVEGEPTLTVTGLKNFDYASLKEKPYLEVLQMANEDVTDQTLGNLKGMTKLRQLDLSNTQITDDGLKALKELPKLEVLQLNGTKVTDEGIRQYIFPLESLMELSLQRTKVTRATRLEWRDAKQGRKVAPVF
jgi:hypothetical protein